MMTNRQLQEALAKYPDDWQVWADIEGSQGPISNVDSDDYEKSIVLTD